MADKLKIPLVDAKDNIIAFVDRDSLKKGDIYRVSALWITNSKGEILIAQRQGTKSHHPLKWGPSVAGTVEHGESYSTNIVKEAFEELGLKDIKPRAGKKVLNRGKYQHFTQWFTVVVDKDINDFRLKKDEVEAIRWISKDDLIKELKENPDKFVPSIEKYVAEFL
jgi:isopentenyldiphosphate isomerase